MQVLGGTNISRYRWNQRFETWAGPLSDSEDSRCENAENMVHSAIEADSNLESANLRVFAQGSYKANTNIRADSDIDICICHQGVFFAEYPPGMSDSSFGNSNSGLTFRTYKDQVATALYSHFSFLGVTRGDKSFKVHENTYRINADVVPAFEYRWYFRKNDGTYDYASGIKFISDSGVSVVNWPHQAYRNGVDKNRATGWKYKQVVRILKNLRGEMKAANIAIANDMPSFLIESLVWNVDNSYFDHEDLYEIVNQVTLEAWYRTYEESRCTGWTEVNGIKLLFHPSQPWNRAKASNFLWAVRQYVGFPST